MLLRSFHSSCSISKERSSLGHGPCESSVAIVSRDSWHEHSRLYATCNGRGGHGGSQPKMNIYSCIKKETSSRVKQSLS